MTTAAFKQMYRDEFIAGFEQGTSMLRSCVVTEAMTTGGSATFLVADSGGAEPVTRGLDGDIPARADNLNQFTATLVEWHDKPRRTGFDIFGSQGDGRKIMQDTTVKVMNRKIDQDIIGELNTATQDLGGSQKASLHLITYARAVLGNAEVDIEEEDNMFAVVTPAFDSYMLEVKEYASSQYVDIQPLVGPARKMRRFAGFNFIVHPKLPGRTTTDEHCFFFHRNSIGHAVNSGAMKISAGYNDEDDYYWARTGIFMGSKLLQNSGVAIAHHDGSGFAAT